MAMTGSGVTVYDSIAIYCIVLCLVTVVEVVTKYL
jgi:hypothetical protein